MQDSDLFKIKNKADIDLDKYQDIMDSLLPYVAKHLNIDRPVTINFVTDKNNAKNALGKTGYYHPEEDAVYVYCDDRHIKDILRSMCHELVHHMQNCRGDFEKHHAEGTGYALKDRFLWNRELEAYLEGNKLFRRWEDLYKTRTGKLNERNEKLYNKLMNKVLKG